MRKVDSESITAATTESSAQMLVFAFPECYSCMYRKKFPSLKFFCTRTNNRVMNMVKKINWRALVQMEILDKFRAANVACPLDEKELLFMRTFK